MLSAVRRVASGIVRDALEDSEYGARGGRIADRAKLIDLEIRHVGEGSDLQVDLVCTARVPPGEMLALFNELLEQTTRKVMDAIDAESHGRPGSAVVRRYLAKLPRGVRRQRYDLMRGTTQIRRVEVGTVDLPELPENLPYFARLDDAHVVGVGFGWLAALDVLASLGLTLDVTAEEVESFMANVASGEIARPEVVRAWFANRLEAL